MIKGKEGKRGLVVMKRQEIEENMGECVSE